MILELIPLFFNSLYAHEKKVNNTDDLLKETIYNGNKKRIMS